MIPDSPLISRDRLVSGSLPVPAVSLFIPFADKIYLLKFIIFTLLSGGDLPLLQWILLILKMSFKTIYGINKSVYFPGYLIKIKLLISFFLLLIPVFLLSLHAIVNDAAQSVIRHKVTIQPYYDRLLAVTPLIEGILYSLYMLYCLFGSAQLFCLILRPFPALKVFSRFFKHGYVKSYLIRKLLPVQLPQELQITVYPIPYQFFS